MNTWIPYISYKSLFFLRFYNERSDFQYGRGGRGARERDRKIESSMKNMARTAKYEKKLDKRN